MKIIYKLSAIFLFFTQILFSQLTGGFESNGSWYIDDDKIKLTGVDAEDRIRSNNYLKLDYKWKNFTLGTQLESYLPKALLNYYPEFKDTNLGTYYLNYNNSKIGLDVTAGHFYEQFGSGLTLRAWEDRQLGVAQSILGGKIKFNPSEVFSTTLLYGKQRKGFKLAESTILGIDTEISVSEILNTEKSSINIGGSYVNRNEELEGINLSNPTHLFSTRLDYENSGFYVDGEYVHKTKDAVKDINDILLEDREYKGNALLLNLGYSQKGFSVSSSFRRLENMGFYVERKERGNQYNVANINYIPALTKQNDLLTSNIYVYQAQPRLKIATSKAGEIGGQLDVFYKIKRNTKIGGKYGLNLAFNFSNWFELDATYDDFNNTYNSEYLGFGEKMYREINFEARKKWSKNYSMIFTYINQFYNKNRVEDINNNPNVKTNIVGLDNNFKLSGKKSLRVSLEHLATKEDKKNWVAGLTEFAFSPKFSVFVSNMYNYGNDDKEKQIHYYNFGANYSKNKTRVSASYGRQRGGLMCIGGVCRYVPESNGVNLGISTSF